ncbi:MAG: EAL domain-containing response regulator [Gammaproteobacteria bacterium]
MIPDNTNRLDSYASKQELLDEIERLQQQVAQLEDKVSYQEEQLRTGQQKAAKRWSQQPESPAPGEISPAIISAGEEEGLVVAFHEDHLPDANVEPMVDAEMEINEIDLSVLLVDDDPIMHRVSTMILNDLGINNVQSAMSGSKALEMLDHEGAIDVVICDLNMSEMDGIEFIRHLAAQSYSGSLVLTSGKDIRILRTVEKLAIEHELNLLGVLEKPVTPAKFKEILDVLEQSNTEGTVLSPETYEADELLQAIEGDQLDTYFQPKVDVNTGQVVGVEALIRWNHPSRGTIRPYYFITLAEENNLIVKLTQAACAKAFGHATTFRSRGFDLGIALNISVDTLNDLSWPDNIARQIESAGLQPSAVTFEITESRLMEDIAVALDILSRLSLKRFNLSIDDFGTGYSSMEQLQRIPFSELKIDRAFVKGASTDPFARAILESSIQLARKLDMKVVAEGVESRQDWDLVTELGCDQVQGYYIAKPMPIEQFLDWLGRWNLSEHLQAMP